MNEPQRSTWIAVLALLLASAGLFGCGSSTADEGAAPQSAGESNRIQPYGDNPSYWQYKGQPVLLIGGSKEDNLFQISDVEDHLDLLASVGGNYVRNTMNSRDEGNVWPFHRQEDGSYDLDRLSDEYFQQFEQLLRLAHERDIIVQIELWDRFDFAREPWLENPFRPANNVNYTPEESGLENEYPEHPGSNNNPFFRSVPAQNDNQLLLEYQKAQIDSLLEISLQYPNVLYCMDNETSANPDWGAYWARYVKEKARETGVEVYVTEMWDAWDLKDESTGAHSIIPSSMISPTSPKTITRPTRSTARTCSGSVTTRRRPRGRSIRSRSMAPIRAITVRPGMRLSASGAASSGEALRCAFTGPHRGSASVKPRRPTHLQSARKFTARFDLFNARPDAEHKLLNDRSSDEAYLSYVPDRQYAVYFTDGGAVELDLRDADGTYRLRWLDIGASEWTQPSTVEGEQHIAL